MEPTKRTYKISSGRNLKSYKIRSIWGMDMGLAIQFSKIDPMDGRGRHSLSAVARAIAEYEAGRVPRETCGLYLR